MNNFNLFEKDWINIVFENRNQLYGAYKLRKESAKTTLLALFLGIGLLSLVFGSSYLYASKNKQHIIIVELPDNPVAPTIVEPIDKIEPPVVTDVPKGKSDDVQTAATTVKDVIKNVKFTEMQATADENVTTNDLASQNDFDDNTQSSQVNTEAYTDGTLNTSGVRSGTTEINTNVTNTTTDGGSGVADNTIVRLVQKKAAPIEGYNKFIESFVRKFSRNSVSSNVSEITVKLKFVVEKDGSFTDIKTIEDQYGLGKEAIRVLQSMPKWQPAQHNGKAVRSSFILPIKVKINN